MSHLYLSPSLRYFELIRLLPNAPVDHMCFEYDIVEALRPKVLVDVGTGDAATYFVFCQSMRDHDVDGLCFAVDLWADDEGKPEDDPTHSLSINRHARAYYRGFTLLMRMRATEALAHFAEDSIDLLRLDPARHDEPFEELLLACTRRLAPGGVLLCPGVSTPRVRSAWDRAGAGHHTLIFNRAGGLGVLRRRPASADTAELLQLIASSDPSDSIDLDSYYAHAALHHSLRRSLRPQPLKVSAPRGTSE